MVNLGPALASPPLIWPQARSNDAHQIPEVSLLRFPCSLDPSSREMEVMSAQSQITFMRCEGSFQLGLRTHPTLHPCHWGQHRTPDNQDHDALNINHHTTGHSLTELTGLVWSEVTTKQSRLAHATTD